MARSVAITLHRTIPDYLHVYIYGRDCTLRRGFNGGQAGAAGGVAQAFDSEVRH